MDGQTHRQKEAKPIVPAGEIGRGNTCYSHIYLKKNCIS